jgi:MoaA/NifB/PqqE/SkfB family radical SAM enzyme
MKTKSNDYSCPIMRHQLTINQLGRVMPCCHFGEHVPIDQYKEITTKYAERLEAGEKIPQCNGCWKTEERGLVSVRQSAINNYEQNYADNNGINAMDIRLHNKCNMACNMCGSYNSTLWGKIEGKEEVHTIGETNLQYVYSLANNVTKLSIQGGESFYGNEFVNFVDNFPTKKDLTLDVFTNVVTTDISVVRRWHNECKSLLINASIDGTDETFEYIRWPGTWKKAQRKTKQIYEIIGGRLKHFFAIQSANLENIFDFIEWRNTHTPDSEIVFNLVEGPKELSIDASTQQERDNFIETFNYYKGYLSDRERYDLTAVYDLCKELQDDEILLNMRNVKNSKTNQIRENYLKRNDPKI